MYYKHMIIFILYFKNILCFNYASKNKFLFKGTHIIRGYGNKIVKMKSLENDNFKIIKNNNLERLITVWLGNMMSSNNFESKELASLIEFRHYVRKHNTSDYINFIWIPETNRKKNILYILSVKYQQKREVFHINRVVINPFYKNHNKCSIQLFHDFYKMLSYNKVKGKIDYTNLLEVEPFYKMIINFNVNNKTL